ncbi:MAG: DUF3035 domain-containing protein [Magnetovibrio sp.]|nr:DUF3035 domain-containing protein [Magnetovibrio sp.]
MKNTTAILIAVAGGILLSSCADVRQSLTQTKAIPDEFAVYTRAPLTMPPDYGVRPMPGPDGGDDLSSPQETARRVLLENSSRTVVPVRAATPGTTALLTRAGVRNSDPNIRQVINKETTAFAEEDKTVIESMLFWRQTETGAVVNAAEETKRIQESQALGTPVSEGSSPVIEPRKKAPLEGVFSG